jgi:hypothetical protein
MEVAPYQQNSRTEITGRDLTVLRWHVHKQYFVNVSQWIQYPNASGRQERGSGQPHATGEIA